MPIDPFQASAVQRRADFRRIARQTDGEHTADDVENEAWLIAERIFAKRGSVINFSLRADQKLVLAWLHNELVSYTDKQLRYAVKLDKDWDNDDAGRRGRRWQRCWPRRRCLIQRSTASPSGCS